MFGYFWSRNATLGMAALYLVLGIVLIANPFGVAKTVIRFFGIGLIVDGVCDLITVLSARGR